MMEEHFKPEKANETRWVGHKLRDATKLIANWKLIVIHLQSCTEGKTVTQELQLIGGGCQDNDRGHHTINRYAFFKLIFSFSGS